MKGKENDHSPFLLRTTEHEGKVGDIGAVRAKGMLYGARASKQSIHESHLVNLNKKCRADPEHVL